MQKSAEHNDTSLDAKHFKTIESMIWPFIVATSIGCCAMFCWRFNAPRRMRLDFVYYSYYVSTPLLSSKRHLNKFYYFQFRRCQLEFDAFRHTDQPEVPWNKRKQKVRNKRKKKKKEKTNCVFSVDPHSAKSIDSYRLNEHSNKNMPDGLVWLSISFAFAGSARCTWHCLVTQYVVRWK